MNSTPKPATADCLIALDQGTSGTKALLVDAAGQVIATAYRALDEHRPQPGHVEQDPAAIWGGVLGVLGELAEARPGARVAGLALSVQREAVMAWDPATGKPLSRLISWQDRRTADRCRTLAGGPFAALITERSGLPVDPMFSATKAAWLLDELDPDRTRARAGQLRIGTLDAWLLRCLTQGTAGPAGDSEVTEVGCASRTQLLSLDTGDWDPDLLELFGVPVQALPRVVPSTGPLGHTRGLPILPDGVPVGAVLGDSHAALFAQSQGRPGVVKATYGSGSSLMALCPPGTPTPDGVSRTLAWQRAGRAPEQALEANIASAGTAVRWAARLLGTDPAGIAELAAEGRDEDLYLVPAFHGLGAPYWDRSARALLIGIGANTGPAEIARAAVESLAYQVADAFARFGTALGGSVAELRTDGGPTANDRLMSFQAELIGRPVRRAGRPEISALGAAHLAGLALGMWDEADLASLAAGPARFAPTHDETWREARLRGWRDAVTRSRGPVH
ncbi:FGGY family carbohydrate kinase [Streptomyces ochraceiscleroticus]|uniref:ATP:glycerol 3-phosphotransferase n=1 Tax=Streptomyces ochraceiscleroticus TaxID=47761 RepID=A0ABW1MPU8_9ACTN|nr:FGGY family carbohydrate kinase [Streptomyces ochraceiscleroticus]